MTMIEPFLFAGIGQEFDAKNSVTIMGGASSVRVTDKPVRTFGIGSLGFNMFGDNGFSGSIRIDGFVGSHMKSVSFWAGLRFAT